jgi:hypothetical protein
MCVIILCPPGETPDRSDLIDSTFCNPDGHGFSILAPDQPSGFVHQVSMDADLILEAFMATRERYPDQWAVWHSRFATHGIINDTNCQPFAVPGKRWIMAHNGVLPLSDGPFWSGPDRSDSKIFCEEHVARTDWGRLNDVHVGRAVEEWLDGSKIVVLSAEPEHSEWPVVLFNEDHGDWMSDGCWWSSRPYRPKVKWWIEQTPEDEYYDEELEQYNSVQSLVDDEDVADGVWEWIESRK